MWRPTEPGHYVAKVDLIGDARLSCRIDLDVVEQEAEREPRPRRRPSLG
jgi:hypothetical protein